MAEAEWIKLYLKTFRTSRKISAIERMKNGDTFIVIWFKLLCLAGEINDGGAVYITPNKPFDPVSLADELKKTRVLVEAALDVFEDHDMIIKDDSGLIQILNWEKYQNIEGLDKIRKQTRERVARCRANKSNADVTHCNATSNADVTHCNAIEEEEEREIHSFNHSIAREENDEKDNSTDLSTMRKRLGGELGGGVVFLSDEQMSDLLDRLTIDEFDYYVAVVRDQELQGKHYKKKTHYRAIMDMAMKDRKIK